MSMAAEHTSRALTFRQYSTGCAEPQRVRTPHVLEETLEVVLRWMCQHTRTTESIAVALRKGFQ